MFANQSEAKLIDMLYEAAIAPELWRPALDEMVRFSGAQGAMMMHFAGESLTWDASENFHPHVADYFDGGWSERTPRTRRILQMNCSGFVRDIDALTAQELKNDPVQRDFLLPRGFGRELGTVIPVPSGDLLVVTTHFAWKAGPIPASTIDRMDKLRPHLARAVLLTGRLKLERGRSAVQALQAMGLSAAALASDGRVLVANGYFSKDQRLVELAGDRVGLRDTRAQALLESALLHLRCGMPNVMSVLIAASEGTGSAALHVIPIRGAGRDIVTSGLALLVITGSSPNALPEADMLHALFDLTPAEARLARGLAAGKTLSDLATASGLSRQTLRSQLKEVMSKTNVHRQADLVRLLSVLPPGR